MRKPVFEQKQENKEKTRKIEKAKADYKKLLEKMKQKKSENRIKDDESS